MRDRINEQPPINFTPTPGADAFAVRSTAEARTIRVPFGKHRGKLLSAVPADALVWLNSKVAPGFLKDQIVREMNRREAGKSPRPTHISAFRRESCEPT